MVKIITLATLIIVVILAAICYADPGDIVITITIPAAKVAEFRTGFLAAEPVPVRKGSPKYTEKEWLQVCVRDYLRERYANGKRILAYKASVIDPNVVE